MVLNMRKMENVTISYLPLIHLQSLLSASSSIAFHSILSQFIFKSDFCILGFCYCNNLLLQGDLDIFQEEQIVAILISPPSYIVHSIPLSNYIIFSVMCSFPRLLSELVLLTKNVTFFCS